MATLHLPLLSTPFVALKAAEDEDDDEELKTLPGNLELSRLMPMNESPVLRALSESFVLALRFRVTAVSRRSLRRVLQDPNILPCAVFDTRMHAANEEPCARRLIEEQLPALNADQLGVRALHWALGVLASQPGASPDALRTIQSRCVQLADHLLGALNPLLGKAEQVTAATAAVYAAADAGSNHCADTCQAFDSALTELLKMRLQQVRRSLGSCVHLDSVLLSIYQC